MSCPTVFGLLLLLSAATLLAPLGRASAQYPQHPPHPHHPHWPGMPPMPQPQPQPEPPPEPPPNPGVPPPPEPPTYPVEPPPVNPSHPLSASEITEPVAIRLSWAALSISSALQRMSGLLEDQGIRQANGPAFGLSMALSDLETTCQSNALAGLPPDGPRILQQADAVNTAYAGLYDVMQSMTLSDDVADAWYQVGTTFEAMLAILGR